MEVAIRRKLDDVGPGCVEDLLSLQRDGPLQHSIAKSYPKRPQKRIQCWNVGATCTPKQSTSINMAAEGCCDDTRHETGSHAAGWRKRLGNIASAHWVAGAAGVPVTYV